MTAAQVFMDDQRVYTNQGAGTVIFTDHNQPCPVCRNLACYRCDVKLDSGNTVTACGRKMRPALVDGQTISIVAGPVVISVQCIRPGYAYRLSIRHTSPLGGFDGAEIDELSRSFADEHTARRAARTATVLFGHGLSVQDVVDLVVIFSAPAGRP